MTEDKLKTLKDLEEETLEYWRKSNKNISKYYVDAYACQSHNLRQVAREWIDVLMKNAKNNYSKNGYKKFLELLDAKDLFVTVHDMIYMDVDKINWINHFFNLRKYKK
jgi:hypothetical protein